MTTPSGAPRWCTECRTRRQCPRRAPRVMRSLRSAVVLGASGAYRNGTKKRTAKRRHAKHERARGGGGGGGRRTADAGFVGIERFVGIPGTVGGGIYMNAGCHGAEFSEVVTEVTVMDARGKVKQLARKQISFKYRASNIESIVLEAKLGLGEESPAKLKELQAKLFRWRKAGTPFDQPCCGSTFINPSGTKTAGMLIDECGLKGFTIGGAQVSTQHANYIINKGTATASDVLKVIDHIRKTVAKKTGVTLELECKVIGV